MRLLVSAIVIIVAFGLGVWAIAGVLADTAPAWVGVTLAMVWLFVLVFAGLHVSSDQPRKRGDQGRLLAYALVAAALSAAFLAPIFIYNIKVPKLAAEAVVGGIGVAVFMFAKYMEHRNNRSPHV